MALSHERSLSRPSIPLLLQCGVVFWLGCLLAEFLDYNLALSAALLDIAWSSFRTISSFSQIQEQRPTFATLDAVHFSRRYLDVGFD